MGPRGGKAATPGSQVRGSGRGTLIFAHGLWVESKRMEEKGSVTWIKPLLCTKWIICITPKQGNRNQGSKMEPNLTKPTC